MSLWELLERAEQLHSGAIAIRVGPLHRTYAELGRRARAQARWMQGVGCAGGERAAILELNGAGFLQTSFAAAGAGAVLVPLNVRLSAPELAGILRQCGARLLYAGIELAPLVREVRALDTPLERVVWSGVPAGGVGPDGLDLESVSAGEARGFDPTAVAGDDLAQLYFTSGTTGTPKGVMLTQRNIRAHAVAAVEELALSASDVWGHIAPMFHLADAWAIFAITHAGGQHAFVPRFEERAVLELLQRDGVTLTNLIPTMLTRLVRFPGVEQLRFERLRLVLSGGAPIAPEVVRRVMEVFRCEYVQTYGMTETSPYLTLSLLDARLRALPPEQQFRLRAKTGRPFRGVELRVLAEDGTPVPADGRTVGEIHARGETVTPGYWRDPEATAAAIRGGWLSTGDLATLDEHGFLDIVDRKKDMIISGGEKIYSTEVEHVLLAHPAVLEAAVFGLPDAEWGETVHAAVALRPDLPTSAEELLAFCRARLAGFKTPRALAILPELPKTGTGKIAKRFLRERGTRSG